MAVEDDGEGGPPPLGRAGVAGFVSRRPSWQKSLVAFAFFGALYCALYLSVVTGHASLKTNGAWPSGPLFVADPTGGGPITLPLERLVAVAWSHLRLPLLDPYQGYGVSLLATQAVAVFPPEIAFHLLFPHNYSLWNLARLVFMSYGGYLVAKSLGQSELASLGVGVALAIVGVAPPNLNLEMLNPLLVLPYLLYCLRLLLDPEKRRWHLYFLGLTTATAALGLSGFQELLPLFGLVIVIFGVAMILHFGTAFRAPRRLLGALAAGAIGLVIGAVGMLPTLSATARGAGVNGATDYLSAVPRFWLATLVLPQVAGRGIVAEPSELGQVVRVLGTPVLSLVLFLAVVAGMRYRRDWLFYIAPSLALVAFGIAGYANLFGVLAVFRFYPFDSIIMVRFLEFAWWLPWCLLLGVVLSIATRFSWYELGAGVAVALACDLIAYRRFVDAATIAHETAALLDAKSGLVAAVVILVAFGVALFSSRITTSAILALVVFVAASAYYLPSNVFAPTGQETMAGVTHVARPGRSLGSPTRATEGTRAPTLSYDPGLVQLPTQTFSVQVFGPIIPAAYRSIVSALLPPSATTDAEPDTYAIAPTMYFAKQDQHLVAVLASLGVNEIASPTPLTIAGDGAPSRCQGESHEPRARPGSPPGPTVCRLGVGRTLGTAPSLDLIEYRIEGVSAVTAPLRRYVSRDSLHASLTATLRRIASGSDVVPSVGVVVRPRGSLVPARGVIVTHRSADTEGTTIRLHAASAGLVTLRASYEVGMRAFLGKKPVRPLAVDGGLWTAVRVPPGSSTVTLSYETSTERLEFALGFAGLGLLAGGWLAAGLAQLLAPFRRRPGRHFPRGRTRKLIEKRRALRRSGQLRPRGALSLIESQ